VLAPAVPALLPVVPVLLVAPVLSVVPLLLPDPDEATTFP